MAELCTRFVGGNEIICAALWGIGDGVGLFVAVRREERDV